MSRISSFVAGVVLGASLVFVSLKYHLVRASDGVYWIPKLTAEFQDTYVDVRGFSAADWARHPQLFVAVSQSGESELIEQATAEAADGLVQGVWDRVRAAPGDER